MAMENAAVAGWKLDMRQASNHFKQFEDVPNYWTSSPDSLAITANVSLVKLGSGAEIYAEILPAIEKVEEELLLVTCFWARSETQELLNGTLRSISRRALAQGKKIRVRICLSSLSAWQKLTHTRSLSGHVYEPANWTKTFGLPCIDELGGLDLQIKSIFVLPFSVMHPKFIVLDRRTVFLPSCNVSWENWFEGCVELTGPIVQHFVKFWQSFWASPRDRQLSIAESGEVADSVPQQASTAVFLPSPHHALALIDGFRRSVSPPTPLNLFILSTLTQARRHIYLQTPNLTSQCVLNAIVAALQRGVDFRIVTSKRLMVLEQLVTARITTARCVKWLGRRHRQLIQQRRGHDIEAQHVVGNLSISFYHPRPHTSDPVQSHIKLTIADGELIVLGSGNLDRASWVTSQELGVAVHDPAFVAAFGRKLSAALQDRLQRVYP